MGESTWQKTLNWHLRAPAERLPLPLLLAEWPASWLMHEYQVPGIIPVCATCAAAGYSFLTWWRQDNTLLNPKLAAALSWLTWWRHEKKPKDLQVPRLSAVEAAAVAAAIGGWASAADIWGPLGWTDHMLSWIYLAGWAAGYRWLRRHDAIRAARQRRNDAAALLALKTLWHQILPKAGLPGWHLSDLWKTNLGYEVKLVGSPETELASRIADHSAGIAEKLAHHLGLPYNRIDIGTTDYPGELIASVRTVDVSVRNAAYHPMTMPWPEDRPSPFASWFPEVASIRDPAIWGFTPEDGSPLSVQLLNELGGRVIGCMGTTGSGKSNLLNVLREFITRCADARLVQLNGAKVGDETVWKPLSALTLCGSVAHDEGLRNNIAEALSALCKLVTDRSATLPLSGDSVFQPTPQDPAVVVIIDEVDEIVAHVPGASQMLEFLASKQRASAVSLVLGTQRFVVTSIGGGSVRANMGEVLVGLVERDSEARHATGSEEIPDIRDYAKGVVGYFQVWNPRAKAIKGRGRAFLLGKPPKELACIQRLVRERQDLRDWSVPDMPAMALDGGQSAMAGASSTAEQDLARLRAHLAGTTVDAPQAGPPAQGAAPVPGLDMEQTMRAAIVGVPLAYLVTLERLAAGPDGVTSEQGAVAIGRKKTVTHQYLQLMERQGIVVLTGRGRGRRYRKASQVLRATAPEAPAGSGPAAAGGAAGAAPAQAAESAGPEPVRPAGYVTIHDLARQVQEGAVDADTEQQEVLAQVRQLRDGSRPHPHLAVVDDPESDAS